MSLAPKPRPNLNALFSSDRGARTKKLSLFIEVFFNRTEPALAIIQNDPEQINVQEPFSELTTLHLAIFRQNERIVDALTAHPVTDVMIKDSFGRRAIDMCVYTTNEGLIEAVFARTYQRADLQLEGGNEGPVVPFRR
ncbi:MAG: hypothetical protein ACE360_11325 [Hyphomicrobiales bacterium]